MDIEIGTKRDINVTVKRTTKIVHDFCKDHIPKKREKKCNVLYRYCSSLAVLHLHAKHISTRSSPYKCQAKKAGEKAEIIPLMFRILSWQKVSREGRTSEIVTLQHGKQQQSLAGGKWAESCKWEGNEGDEISQALISNGQTMSLKLKCKLPREQNTTPSTYYSSDDCSFGLCRKW